MSTTAKSALRKAGLFYFVWVMFSYCTGGPFGLEDMVTTSGPGMTLIFLLVIPFFWCIPVSLVSAELTTAMPVEGGFYRWVRAGFGDFWGFLAGWWNWCASFLLGSVYAVQFADYMGFYFPELTGWRHYIVSLAIVAVITYINVRGIQMVGKFATVLELFILLPVLVLVVIGLAKWHHNPFVPVIPPHQPTFHVFGVGLALGLWLYSGYEQCSTVAEEVDNPRRSYPLALALVVPMSIAAYFLPTLASLAALGNWESWHTGFFPTAAQLIGGRWLGAWMSLAAMITYVALLNSTILTSTRMPFAMAEDGYLPHVLTGAASALWDALDCDHRVGGGVRPAVSAFAGAAHQHLQLAAGRDHGHDGARRLATAPQAAGHAAAVCNSRRTRGADLLRGRSPDHERGSAAGQRPLRSALGAGGAGSRAGGVLCVARSQAIGMNHVGTAALGCPAERSAAGFL